MPCYPPFRVLLLKQGLADLGYEIVSTGGSAKAVESAGVPVRKVEDLTGFPEMLDGERAGEASMLTLRICMSNANVQDNAYEQGCRSTFLIAASVDCTMGHYTGPWSTS